MGEKTKVESETKTVQKPTEKYSKTRILSSDTYKRHRDLLKVLLADGKSYTKQEIKNLIDGYLKRRVK